MGYYVVAFDDAYSTIGIFADVGMCAACPRGWIRRLNVAPPVDCSIALSDKGEANTYHKDNKTTSLNCLFHFSAPFFSLSGGIPFEKPYEFSPFLHVKSILPNIRLLQELHYIPTGQNLKGEKPKLGGFLLENPHLFLFLGNKPKPASARPICNKE